MNEIVTRWTSPGSPGGLTVMYFAQGFTVTDQRLALQDLWSTIAPRLASGVSWEVEPVGRVLDEDNGQLTAMWSEPTARTGNGSGPSAMVANSTQVLLRWITDTVVNGRILRGRSYIPGLAAENVSQGALSGPAQAVIVPAAQDFATAGVGFSVWHRPTGGTGGSLHEVTTGDAWNELGVQRGRR